ncbi:hypothetical protein [Robertkochia solimangrovi]|uniref:hypothetical protein n=1 Tax=Robertkochia solimangrovi TaxID=2213046 RepID=UPI0011816A38|nr:hypothetical protein [Robertkochia solimangrovi]TRZ46230.1 hypothetical protein DMZ48_02950 [Robertkochia solimangrovi]
MDIHRQTLEKNVCIVETFVYQGRSVTFKDLTITNMIKELFEEVFKKAREDSGKDTKNGLSGIVCDYLEEELNYPVTQKTLVRYHDQYILGKEAAANSPKSELLNVLSQYLGYENYEAFVGSKESINQINPVEYEDIKHTGNRTLERMLFSVISLILLGALGISIVKSGSNETDCMYWNVTQYELIDCDLSLHPDLANKIIPYRDFLFNHMKKIEADATTVFFDEKKKPIIWYGKGIGGNYEYFTTYGLHPETQKSLKAITPYIIEKYILNEPE